MTGSSSGPDAGRRASTPAVVALQAAGVAHRVLRYHHDPAVASFGEEAPRALGLDPAAVCKTLVAQVDGRLVVAVVPVTGRLDLKALARAAGGRRAGMADPSDAERATGYVVGGISPFGQRRSLPVIVDVSVTALAEVFVSGGRRGLELGLAPADLLRLCRATTAAVAG